MSLRWQEDLGGGSVSGVVAATVLVYFSAGAAGGGSNSRVMSRQGILLQVFTATKREAIAQERAAATAAFARVPTLRSYTLLLYQLFTILGISRADFHVNGLMQSS